MIYAIPNQPVNMSGSLMAGCACDPLVPPTLFDPSQDRLRFQFLMDPCPGASLLDDINFQTSDWVAAGSVVSPGRLCAIGVAGAVAENTQFIPVIGNNYILQFTTSRVYGVFSWSVGGVSGTIGAAGVDTNVQQLWTFPFTATSTAPVSFGAATDSDGFCLTLVEVFEQTREVIVEVLEGGVVVEDFTPDANAEAFTFSGRHVIFDSDLEEVSSCFTVRVTETCGEVDTVLTSQEFIVTNDDCTLSLRVCGGGYDILGMVDPLVEMRVAGKLTHAAWEAVVSDERRSNGRLMRHYGDSQRRMELRIGFQSEYAHPFLSLLPILPSFFIGQQEYVAAGDAYEPAYGDVFDGTGGIVLTVFPKEELRRVVMCGPEPDPCPPPPNYLCQTTGPNDDLIVTQQGEAILLY